MARKLSDSLDDKWPGLAVAFVAMIELGIWRELTPSEQAIWPVLAKWMPNDGRTFYRSGADIAADSGINRARVWPAVDRLVERRLMDRVRRGGSSRGGKREANTYRMLRPVAQCNRSQYRGATGRNSETGTGRNTEAGTGRNTETPATKQSSKNTHNSSKGAAADGAALSCPEAEPDAEARRVAGVRAALAGHGIKTPKTVDRLVVIPGLTRQTIDRLAADAKERATTNPAGLLVTLIEAGGWRSTGATAPAPQKIPESVQRVAQLRAEAAEYSKFENEIERWQFSLSETDYPKAKELSGVDMARWAKLSPPEKYRAWKNRPPMAEDYARGPTTFVPKADYPINTDAAKARIREQAAALKAGKA
ncbi:hypothetical protein HED60_19215 [Planctomycetales bacterium ZRK34]|nr:hypothetical protein HED60_19215 [Planctomycetales bacterium ZRK34]